MFESIRACGKQLTHTTHLVASHWRTGVLETRTSANLKLTEFYTCCLLFTW